MILHRLRSDRALLVLVVVLAVLIASFASLFTIGLLRTADATQRAQQAIDGLRAARVATCMDTNARHDAVIATLDLHTAMLRGADRARADRNREATVALLNALAPRRDCTRPPVVARR